MYTSSHKDRENCWEEVPMDVFESIYQKPYLSNLSFRVNSELFHYDFLENISSIHEQNLFFVSFTFDFPESI